MVKVASCFAQVLNLIDRHGFGAAVRDLDAERGAKGFRCWDQFVGMLFCQLGSAHSLREICGGLATALGKMVHLGLKAAPKRSTLAYANEHRPWELYQRVFEQMLGHCQDLAAGRKRTFRFKNPLRILDATVIDLCLEMFDWARFRRTKGAIKLHMQLQERGCLPCWALVTEGRTHEVRVAQGLTFDPGTIVAMDRAYTDYALFGRWTEQSVFFVTRMKSNAQYEVIHTIPGGKSGVQWEEWIRLTGTAAAECPGRLRRITVWDEKQQREIILLTNEWRLAAGTLARVYRFRWQIELFFKALKQNLRIKTFVGTSENAVKTQIWTALIAMLLLKFLQLKSSWAWSLSNLAAMLRFNLLTYRDLWAWLDDPFGVPISEPTAEQLVLPI
ncbi:MAG: IS4 family transposase [Kiritimatiellae bacterium]|nr:IS4 family transposase [Kiritimatiellia bacterium]